MIKYNEKVKHYNNLKLEGVYLYFPHLSKWSIHVMKVIIMIDKLECFIFQSLLLIVEL
jgi:hypothetical protein